MFNGSISKHQKVYDISNCQCSLGLHEDTLFGCKTLPRRIWVFWVSEEVCFLHLDTRETFTALPTQRVSKEDWSSSGRIPENASRNLSKTAHLHQAKTKMLPFATSLPHITTPDIRLNAYSLYSVCSLTWEMSYWMIERKLGAGVRKRPCVHTGRLGQKVQILTENI